jgi:hypothetical protein
MNKELDTNKNLNYSFIAIPTNLYYCIDNNLRIGLSSLIQLSSVYADADGWFFRTNEDLQNDWKMGKNLTIAVLETLYQNNLLQVRSVGFRKGVRKVNFYRVNFQAFKEFEQFNLYTISRCKELQIETVDYKAKDFRVTYTAITDSFQVDKANNNTSNKNVVNASQKAGNAPTSHSNNEGGQPSSNAEEKPSEGQEIVHESDNKSLSEKDKKLQEIEDENILSQAETSQVVSENNNQLESEDTNQPQSNEEKDNWDWIREIIEDSNEEVRAYVESYSQTAGNAPSSPSNNEGGQPSSNAEEKPSEAQEMANSEKIETASVIPTNVEIRSYNGARLNPKLGEEYNIMINNILNDLTKYCDSKDCKLDSIQRKYLDSLIIRYCKQSLKEMENSQIGYEFKAYIDKHDIDYSDVHAYCDAFGRIVEVFGAYKSNIPF